MPVLTCRICGAAGSHPRHRAREMMLGLRDPFAYFQCRSCGCLQIETIPQEMGRYYPTSYYSFVPQSEAGRPNPVVARLRRARDESAVLGRGWLGRALLPFFPDPALQALGTIGPGRDARILDVGSGAGHHLRALRALRFRQLLGIDPLLQRDTVHPPDLRILKRSIHELDGNEPWDLIMYHHAFEHVPDPLAQLEAVARLLGRGGTCLIRIPICDSEAWERYGVNWVQVDAPRHLHVHSRASMAEAASRAGLSIERVACDSTGFQFWGSEQYRRDIPLSAIGPDPRKGARRFFSRRELRGFERRARRLNRAGRGDQAVFILRTAPESPSLPWPAR